MTVRAFKLLDKHGTRFWFGGTPELGCRDGAYSPWKHFSTHDGTMTLRPKWAPLTLSKHTTRPTVPYYYAFSSATEPPQNLLSQFKWSPPTTSVCLRLKRKQWRSPRPQSVGARQGDNMAPVLFVSLMTVFAETLKIVWRQQEIPILGVMTMITWSTGKSAATL